MKKNQYLPVLVSVMALLIISSACSFVSENSAPPNNLNVAPLDPEVPDESKEFFPDSDEPASFEAFIEIQEPIEGIGGAVIINFQLKNITAEPLYLLKWYTPLEGIAGNIFEVTLNGQEVPYIGIMASRGAPTAESYVFLEAGEEVTAKVNLVQSYDFSQPGVYTIKYRSPFISHIAHSEEQLATTMDELGPVLIPSNTINLEISGPEASAAKDTGSNPPPPPPEIGPEMITIHTTTTSQQGRIDFPFKTADAGNFVLQAGETILFNWLDFPADATFYTIAIKGDQLIKIGTDFDSSDGVMLTWTVPENTFGELTGFACFDDGTCIGPNFSGRVGAGPLPPDQYCTVKLFWISVLDIYLDPDKDSPVIAHFKPGFYTQVYSISEDQWLYIDLKNHERFSDEYSSISKGYIPQHNLLELFGPCDSIQEN